MRYIPFQKWWIIEKTERQLLIRHYICLSPALAKSALAKVNSALFRRGGVSAALATAPYPTKLYSTIELEGFFTFLPPSQFFFIKEHTANLYIMSLITCSIAARACNFVGLFRYLVFVGRIVCK